MSLNCVAPTPSHEAPPWKQLAFQPHGAPPHRLGLGLRLGGDAAEHKDDVVLAAAAVLGATRTGAAAPDETPRERPSAQPFGYIATPQRLQPPVTGTSLPAARPALSPWTPDVQLGRLPAALRAPPAAPPAPVCAGSCSASLLESLGSLDELGGLALARRLGAITGMGGRGTVPAVAHADPPPTPHTPPPP